MWKETQESGGKDVIYPCLSLNLARLVNGVSAFVQYKMRRVVKILRIFIDVDEWFQNDWSLPTSLKLLQLYIIDHLQNSTPLRCPIL